MTARLDTRDVDRMARRGFLPLPAARALAVFDAALDHVGRCGTAHVLALSLDRAALAPRALLATLRPAAPASTVDLLATWAATAAGMRRTVVAGFVADQARRVLGLPGGVEIPTRQPFQELGLDSLMAVELRNAVGAAVGHAQPATLLFDHPTPESLTDHLLSLLRPRSVRRRSSRRQRSRPPPPVRRTPPASPRSARRRRRRCCSPSSASGRGRCDVRRPAAVRPGTEELSPVKRALLEIRDLGPPRPRRRPAAPSRSRSSGSGCASRAARTTRRRTGSCSPTGSTRSARCPPSAGRPTASTTPIRTRPGR